MPAFEPLPLGQAIPDRPHAVSCSLPTMRDVIGYEEKDPETLRHLASGYPRFVVHRFNRQLTDAYRAELDLTGHQLWLCCSARAADALLAELGAAHAIRVDHEGIHGVAHPTDPDLASRAKRYLQNTGGFLSSREAEDRLVGRGDLPAAAPEILAPAGCALAAVTQTLLTAYPGTTRRDLALAPSGMSAFHTAFSALFDLQKNRGRTVWIQLGWLYLDTIAQLKRFAATPDDYVALTTVTDLGAITAAITAAGDRFAGVVTEAPTNPLVQTADLVHLSEVVHTAGGRLLIDPTLVSPLNVDVLPYADLVVNSLTKYAGSSGDIIAGATIINPAGPDADWLRARVERRSDPIYQRDLRRLAAQIGDYADVIARTNANAAAVVAHLQAHPGVKDVFWALHPDSRDNYLKIARSPDHLGSIISFTVHGELADFYDRLTFAKGPSFGMHTTLICPFIYLAHFDLISTPEGRTELAAAGIDPNLLRLSLGTEPIEDILATLDAALPH